MVEATIEDLAFTNRSSRESDGEDVLSMTIQKGGDPD